MRKNFKDFLLEKSGKTGYVGINEVAFNEKRLQKIVDIYSSIMGKQMGGKFKILGLEEFKRKSGSGKGFRGINENGEMIRFNWDSKKSKKAQFDLTSIDYWASSNRDFQKPSRTVTFSPDLNVIQVLGKITDALLTGTIRESQEIIDEANLILEKKLSWDDRHNWLKSNGLPASKASEKNMRAVVADKAPHLSEQLEVFLGQDETNSFEGGLKAVEKQFDQTVYADPDTVFEDIEDLLGLVAAGKWRTLIICGQGGIGKTFHVTEGPRSLPKLLGPEGDKWTYHSGTKAAPFSFYKTLFQERDKIIVFDEADSLLKNKDIIMMLKPILDTSGANMAEYMAGTQNMVGQSADAIREYCAEVDKQIADGKMIGLGKKDVKLPSKFFFDGAMIFISNMAASEIEGAVMSRSIFIDVHLAEQDIIKRIQSIAMAQAQKDPDTSEADVLEIMEALGSGTAAPTQEINYMTPEYARKHKQMTVRAYSLANTMRKAGIARWAHLASLYA